VAISCHCASFFAVSLYVFFVVRYVNTAVKINVFNFSGTGRHRTMPSGAVRCRAQCECYFWSRISPGRMMLSTSWKRRYQPQSLIRSTYVGSLTTEFTRLMFTHPKWTLRVLCRLMQLQSPRGFARSGISPQSDLQLTLLEILHRMCQWKNFF